MAITYIGVSANAAAASGDLTVTPPATETNDIMVCAVTTHDNVALSFPSGWTIYQEGNNTTAMRSTLAWKRCVGAEAAFIITHTAGNGIVANVIVFRGCAPSGSPIHASSLLHNASSSTCTATAISTTVAGCGIVFTMHDSDNGASSVQTCTDPGTLTEQFDNASTSGLDQAVSGAWALKSTTGSTGNATGTLSLGPDVNSGGLTALAPDTTVTLSPTGIPTGEVLGTLKTIFIAAVTGILTAEAFGAAGVAQIKSPSGIPTGEAFGTMAISRTMSPSGIPTAEALGTPTVSSGGGQTINPPGIVSGEAFGIPAVGRRIFPSGIASSEAFGNVTIQRILAPTAIPTAEAFGTPIIQRAINPSGIPTGEIFGSPALSRTIVPTGILSAELFGFPLIVGEIQPTGIVSAEMLGTPQVKVTTKIIVVGIESAAACGLPKLALSGDTIGNTITCGFSRTLDMTAAEAHPFTIEIDFT